MDIELWAIETIIKPQETPINVVKSSDTIKPPQFIPLNIWINEGAVNNWNSESPKLISIFAPWLTYGIKIKKHIKIVQNNETNIINT